MALVKLTTILFDAGGTLVFPNFQRIVDELGPDGVGLDLARLAQADADVRRGLDDPAIIAATNDGQRFSRYLHLLAQAVGLPDIPPPVMQRLQAYHDEQNLWEQVPPDVVPALELLRKRFRMGVVSNANGTVRQKLRRIGLADFFETIVDSHEEGIEKPDPRLFEVALSRMNVRAEDTAYVGDLYFVDVIGARAAGLRPFLLDPYGLYAGLHSGTHPQPAVAHIRGLADLAVVAAD
jgi:putative hydrolase of the HAD superfamily